MIDASAAHAAVEARDPRFDGRFFLGVTSTGIYCRCVCTAKTPKPANRRFFPSAAAAEKAGFRPCRLCRPELAPGDAPVDSARRLAHQALTRIEAGVLEEEGLERIASGLGVTGRHLRRVMNETFGASPIDIAQTCRLLAAKRLLADSDLPMTEIAFASGFRSVRRFNAVMRERYGLAPQKMRGRNAARRGDAITLRLTARGAYNAEPIFSFMARRALPEMEIANAQRYARALAIGDARGWIDVRAEHNGIALTVSDTLVPVLRPLIAHVRGAFDLDTDCAAVDAHLAIGEEGVRIAGGLDGFEIAARAVLGQQVSLSAACTLAARLVAEFGEELENPPKDLRRLFPSPARVAEAGPEAIAKIGMPLKRAQTLHRLSCAVRDGLNLQRGAIASGREGLAEITGVGPWTVEYVALRALGDPDAFPENDAVLRAELGDADADRWRPWRGYAAMRLWRAAERKRANRKAA
ncbi:MAG: Ada metal-binding domain-containing protein [Caulobacterales bacterium]